MLSKIKSIVNFFDDKIPFKPNIGIILGTGLGGLIEKMEIIKIFSYKDIPDFPISTVEAIVED